jgi:hypothetical protein
MDLNPEIDLAVNTEELTAEFKKLSLILYRYYVQKALAEREMDMAKGFVKEARASIYKVLKADTTTKRSESHIEAEIDTNEMVIAAEKMYLARKYEFATWIGAVDSMKAKKDLLIQLGSDRRKEI